MNIVLHTEKCLSCGMCASIAPELFSIDTGVVSFKKDPKDWTAKDWKMAQEAAVSCPNGVIEITK
jgi:ferredoxin